MRARGGFTLLELLLALGLFSILVLALVQLIDTSLGIWRRTETGRDRTEVASTVLDLVAQDLRAVEGGPRGDLLCDWSAVDLDGDGVVGPSRPRLRFVRQLSPRELVRRRTPAAGRATPDAPWAGELVEVAWAVLPGDARDGDARAIAIGRLVRAERTLGEPGDSLFAPGFFDVGGPKEALRDVSDGCLWLGLRFASRSTELADGWDGIGPSGADTSWDAWGRGRCDPERSVFNAAGRGAPNDVRERPALPRRVLVELELERAEDLRWRPRLAADVEPAQTRLAVDDGERAPRPGSHVLVGDEWMRVGAVDGDVLTVERARRGTRAVWHGAGTLVHHGWRMLREVPLGGVREDWDS